MTHLFKTAKITTSLQPYQERVRDRMRRGHGLVVAHGMGSGKTLTAIAVADDQPEGSDVRFVVPPSLLANIPKEIDKHTRGGLKRGIRSRVQSQALFARDGIGEHADVVIVDEAHRARNPQSLLNQKLHNARAKKMMLMTGTPIYNHPADIAPLINLAAGSKILQELPNEFEAENVKHEDVWPSGFGGFMYRLQGGTPGLKKTLRPSRALRKATRKYVDYVGSDPGDPNFPHVSEEIVRVDMSPRQRAVYTHMLGQLPADLRRKVRENLPPNRQEAQKLVAFLNGPRQITTSLNGFDHKVTPIEAAHDSPKLQRVLDDIQRNPVRRVVYSNFIDAGINPMEAGLQEKGIQYGRFTGSETKKKRDALVKQFNSGQLSTLLVSSAGAEGLDLQGVRVVDILDPHWNESKIEQVKARARRFKSHTHLPKNEQNVSVRRYLAGPAVPQGFLRKMLRQPQLYETTTDGYIHDRSAEKEVLNNQMTALMRESQNLYTSRS